MSERMIQPHSCLSEFKAEPRYSTKGEIPGNGMLEFGVIVRIGRKVLIDEDAYFRWIDAQQGRSK